MGVLTDYFAANAAELAKADERGVPEKVAKVDAKGFGVIPFGQLAKRLLGKGGGVEPGQPLLHGDGYEWFVQRIVPEMGAALAAMTAGEIAKHAGALAGTDDLQWSEELTIEVLARLRELAKKAKKGKRDLYLWCSV